MKRTIGALTIHLTIVASCCAVTHKEQAHSLSNFDYGAAWVLPVTSYPIQNIQTECIILGRETFGADVGTYDAFGGKKDTSDKKKCSTTAARELAEEAITRLTLNMSIDAVKKHIDLTSGNTSTVLAIHDLKYHARTVTYLTRFSQSAIKKLVSNFPAARAKVHFHAEQEKDALALVTLEDFKAAVKASSRNSHVIVPARVWGDKGTFSHQTIELRPIFVRLMRSYIENKPYEPGEDPRIRFYTIS